MNTWRWILASLTVIVAGLAVSSVASAVTLDRLYRLGDAAGEGAADNLSVGAGNAFGVTFDEAGLPLQGQLVDLTPVNTPTYRTINGRPDGVGGLGIEFKAAQQEYLHGFSLGFPQDSFSSSSHTTVSGGNLNYTAISNRGFQFWVRPLATTAQTIVMDTNRHGVRIDSSGRYSMRYNGVDFDSGVSVTAGQWSHIMVIRPAGAANGSRMYVNGVAAVTAPGGYADDWADLVLGANTAGDDSGDHGVPPVGFTGGTTEFFSGIIDDLEMFVMGKTPPPSEIDYGTFDFGAENDFAATQVSGVLGDVTNNGTFNSSDKAAFIAGWMDRRLVGGIQVGDMVSLGQGDLNFDGITDIKDLLIMQSALAGAGMGAITAAELQGATVPEPSTLALLLIAAISAICPVRSRRS